MGLSATVESWQTEFNSLIVQHVQFLSWAIVCSTRCDLFNLVPRCPVSRCPPVLPYIPYFTGAPVFQSQLPPPGTKPPGWHKISRFSLEPCTYGDKLSAQRNETETKQFQNCFETVLFQFHFVVPTVLCATTVCCVALKNSYYSSQQHCLEAMLNTQPIAGINLVSSRTIALGTICSVVRRFFCCAPGDHWKLVWSERESDKLARMVASKKPPVFQLWKSVNPNVHLVLYGAALSGLAMLGLAISAPPPYSRVLFY